jgi:signal transduction histidine kinase/ActR/RegA family two-component response regulator
MTDTPSPHPAAPAVDGRALADASDEWLCELDAELRVRWSSHHVREFAGVDRARAVGQSWAALAGVTWPDDAVAALMRRTPIDVDLRWRRPEGGTERRGRLRLRPAAEGRWTLSLRDRSQEHSLAAEARRLAELLDTAQEFGRMGVWEREIPSGQGRWDRHVFRFWGLDPGDGTPNYDEAVRHIHPDDRDATNEYFRASFRKPGAYAVRYRVMKPGGEILWIHSQWEVKASAGGAPDHVIGVMLDDSEAYRLAQSANEASDRLRMAAELANVTFWKHDLRSNRIFHSVSDWVLAGIDPRPDGLPIEVLRDVIHPDDRQTVLESAHKAIETGKPVDFVARYRGKGGDWRHVLSRRVLQRDENGQPAAFLGVSLDLTDQVSEQRRSAELARRLAMAVTAGGIGLWSRRLDGSESEWNAQMHAIYGRDPALGAPSAGEWLDMVHPDDRAIVTEAMAEVRANPGVTIPTQFRVRRPDGSLRWIENRATLDPSVQGELLYGVALDMTERVQTELTLRSLNDRAQMVARGAGIGTWVLDMRTGRAIWDEQMFHLRGVPLAADAPDAVQRLAMVHPDDRHLFDSPDTFDDSSLGARSIEFRVLRADGSVRWLASRSSVVNDPAGRAVLRVGVNWDVTEARVAAQAREEREVALRESRAKSQFLARMSHELRTPLNAILGFAQLLQLDLPADTPAATKLGNIRRAGEHLLSLINDVLDLSSLETGGSRLARDRLSLPAAVDDAASLLAEVARARDVTLCVGRVDGEVVGDALRLRQVLLNLLNNAIKFNRPGGTVWIDALPRGDRWALRVSDNGPGIAPDRLAQVGEPFNRLGAEARGVEGTGIGLTIVRALVEAMGGRFEIASPLGQGTTVEVELPAAAADTPIAAPERPAIPSAARAPDVRGRVLYIEDNPVNVLLVQEFVRSQPGLEFASFGTGTEGVAQAVADPPDAVLIDMQLPDIDGYEVLRRLRADARTRSLPCVALSANAMTEDIERALAAGFDDYWTKPIDFRAFLGGLRSVLERGRTGVDTVAVQR